MMFSCKMENDTTALHGSVVLGPFTYDGENSVVERGLAESKILCS